jgi:hypothetical protein
MCRCVRWMRRHQQRFAARLAAMPRRNTRVRRWRTAMQCELGAASDRTVNFLVDVWARPRDNKARPRLPTRLSRQWLVCWCRECGNMVNEQTAATFRRTLGGNAAVLHAGEALADCDAGAHPMGIGAGMLDDLYRLQLAVWRTALLAKDIRGEVCRLVAQGHRRP